MPKPSEPSLEPTTRERRRSWRRTAIQVAVVLAVVLAFRAWQTRDAPAGPAPALAGVDLSGARVDLQGLAGEPVLVHFWATWCGICRTEHPTIDSLAREHRVLTVASQSGPPEAVARHLRDEGVDFPVIVDPRGTLARRWGVRAYPTSFIVGPDGTIRNVEVGYTTSIGLRARLWLAR